MKTEFTREGELTNAATAEKDGWVEETLPFQYFFGEFCLFVLQLRSHVLKKHFTELQPVGPSGLDLPEEIPTGLDTVAAPSRPIDQPLPQLTFRRGYIRYVPTQYNRYFVDLRGSLEGYLSEFSSKSRYTLLRKVRRFKQAFPEQPCFKTFSKPEEMAEFHSLARDVSSKTYQEKIMRAGIPDSDQFKEELVRLSRQDSVRGYILYSKGKPIAYICCQAQGRAILYKYNGYDSAVREWSPGTVLQYLVLESLFAERKFLVFDFTPGEGKHKEFFATGRSFCADVYFFRRNFRSYLIVLAHAGLTGFSRGIVALLDKLALKARVKKFFRSHS